MSTDATDYAINPDILISDLQAQYPEVIEFLVQEYGFHCASCFLSSFETLRQGAAVHMITGEYFEEMMKEIGRIIDKKQYD